MYKKLVSLSLKLTSQLATAFSYTLEITEQELQEKLSSMMPLEKKKRYYTIVVSDPEIDLIQETNQVGLFANIEAVILGRYTGSGRVQIKGLVSYDADQSAFYFKDPTIVSLKIDKVPEKYNPRIKKIAQHVIGKALEAHPVYSFNDESTKHKLAKSLLKSVQVKNERLMVELGK